MFSKESCANICSPVSRAVAWAWVIFTTLYFLLSLFLPSIIARTQTSALQGAQDQGYKIGIQQAMQSLSGNVYQNGQNSVVASLVGMLDKQFNDGCKEPIPVTIGTGSIGIISIPCLQKLSTQSQPSPGSSQKK